MDRSWWSESESEVAQSCLTLGDPMDCSLPDSSVHGIFQAIVLEWIAISFSRRSSQPRYWTWVSYIVDRCFTVWATRECSDKSWSTRERNGKSLQYSCLEKPMNSMKRQKDRTLKDELSRSLGSLYATGEQWRNNSRKKKRRSQSKNSAQLWMWLVMEVKSDAVKSNIA